MIRTGLMKLWMWAIIPIALTLVFFATVDLKTGNSWVSFVFVWLAYLTVSVSCLSYYRGQHAILNYTLFISAIGYFFIEIIVAIVFLYFYTDTPKWAFAAQLLLYVVYVLLFGFVYITNHKTNHQIQELKDNISLIDQWKTKVAIMQLRSPSDKTKELYDILKATPVKSNSAVKDIDEEITKMIEKEMNSELIIKKLKERNLLLRATVE